MANDNGTSAVIGEVRFSYAQVWEPGFMKGEENKPGAKKYYSVAALWSKSNSKITNMVNAVIDAAIEADKAKGVKGKLKGKGRKFKNFTEPLRDGDEDRPENPEYANCYFINLKIEEDKGAPQIVNARVHKILDKDEFYSGCYGYVSFSAWAFDNQSVGVGLTLGNLQKSRDGDRLSGATRASAEDDFEVLDIDEDFKDIDDLV